MNTTDNLTNVPPEPGTLLRNRESKIDYVIQSVTTIVGSSGFLYYLLKVSDGRIEQYKASNLDQLNFYVIRANPEYLPPEMVRQQRKSFYESVFKNNQDVLNKIETKEGAVYRDILDILKDADDVNIQRKFVDLSDALIKTHDSKFTQEQVLKIIKDTLGNHVVNFSEEHLETLSKDIVRTMTNGMKLDSGTGFIPGRGVGDLVSRYDINKDKGFVKFLQKDVFGPKLSGRLKPNEDIYSKNPKLSNILETQNRYFRAFDLAKEALGRRPTNDLIRKLLSRDEDEFKAGALKILGADNSGILSDLYLKYHKFADPRQQTFKYGQTMYNRRTAVASQYKNKVTQRINFSSYLEDTSEVTNNGLRKYAAIAPESFLNDFLRTKPVTYGNEVLRAGDKRLGTLFTEMVGNSPGVLISKTSLRKFNGQDSIDFKEIEREHRELKTQIKGNELDQISSKLGIFKNTLFAKRPLVEFGLPEIASGPMHIPGNVIQADGGQHVHYFPSSQYNEAVSQFGAENLTFSDIPDSEMPAFPFDSPQFKKAMRGRDWNPISHVNSTKSDIDFTAEAVNIKAAYINTREQGRMGFAMIEDATGVKALRLTGSQYNIDLQTQLQRGFESLHIYDSTSLRVDIESATNPVNGQVRITQLTAAHNGGLDFDFNSKTGTIEEEAAGIINFAKLTQQAKYIGTQGSHDFDTLVERSRFLAEQVGEGSKLHPHLIQANQILQDARLNKGYDVIPLLNAAGPIKGIKEMIELGLGNASQPRAARDLLGEIVTHSSADDVAQSFRITDKLGLKESKFLGVLSPADLKNANKIFYGEGTRIGGLSGNILKLSGFENSGIKGPGITATFTPMIVKDGKLVISGSEFNLSGSSANALGSMFHGLSEVTDMSKENLQKLHLLSNERSEDLAGRYLRNLNPLSKSFYDSTNQFDPTVSGYFGAHELTVMQDARSLMTQHREAFDHVKLNLGGLTEDTQQSKVDNLINKMLEDGNLPKDTKTHAGYLNRLRFHLEEAIANPQHEQMLGSKAITDLSNSEVGSALISLTRGGLNGNINSFNEAAVLGIRAYGALADNPNMLSTFVSDPRLGLHIPGGSAYLGAAKTNLTPGMSPASIESVVKSLSSQSLVEYSRGNKHAREFLAGQNIKASVVDHVNKLREVHETAGSTSRYEDLLQSMHHFDTKNSEFGEITSTLDALQSSPEFRTHIKTSILNRKDAFLGHYQHIDSSIDAPGVAKSIEARLDHAFKQHTDASKALSHFMHESMSEDFAGTNAYFTDVTEHALDPSKIAHLDPNFAKSLVTKTKKDLEDVVNSPSSSILDQVLMSTQDTLKESKIAGDAFHESMQHTRSMLDDSLETMINSDGSDAIKNLTEIAVKYQTNVGSKRVNLNAMSLEAATKTQAAAGRPENTLAAHHEIVQRAMTSASVDRYLLPIIAVGSALAMVGAAKAPQEKYSGGSVSEQTPGLIGAMSEIPGNSSPPTVFVGQQQPFQLNINVKGFVNSEFQKNQIETKLGLVAHNHINPSKTTERTHNSNNIRAAYDVVKPETAYQNLLASL